MQPCDWLVAENCPITPTHLHALSLIRRSKEKNFIIFSDSMSSLEAISGFKLEIDIVQNIIKDHTNLASRQGHRHASQSRSTVLVQLL